MQTILILASVLASSSARADGFKAMARELSRAAKKAGVLRVAVMPFVPVDGASARDGWNISEKLVTQLVRTGKVQALERSMLKTMMGEHQLAQTGAFDPDTVRKLGRVLAAEGIVTGSFVAIGGEFVINARLIDTETGAIVGASERRAARDWFDLPGLFVPAPEFSVDVPTIVPEVDLELRDSLAEESCVDAAVRVDSLENEILDLKARYWALQLKNGVRLAALTVNPGSTISDPELKQEFYDRMKSWYAQKRVRPLSPVETKHFVALDGAAYSLHKKCRL